MEEMEKHGYTQYEISNFAHEGKESNIIYFIGIMMNISDLVLVHMVCKWCEIFQSWTIKKYMETIDKGKNLL